MKIVFTGGGTGGHFYPIIAVAQALHELIQNKRLVAPELFYLADTPFNEHLLFENSLQFKKIPAGKWRRYFSLRNFTDLAKTLVGLIAALWQLYRLYPDLVFSKGGYASVPVVWAARFLKIPVFVHESDSRPGRANLWAAKFAARVALSYATAARLFPTGKTAVTGNPIRQELLTPITQGAHAFLKFDPAWPIIFVVGGSLGAAAINDIILDLLPELLKRYQIIHSVGAKNLAEVKQRANFLLAQHPERERYQLYETLEVDALRMVAGVASLALTRAGSALFEFAQWGLPAIVIPIPEQISHDQRTNAFTYARSGGAVVIEQANLTGSILKSEIDRLLGDKTLLAKMAAGAKSFARPEAARLVATEILNLALEHET